MSIFAAIGIALVSCAVFYGGYRFWPPGGPFLRYHPRDLTDPKSWRNWYGNLPKHPDNHAEGFSFDLGGDKEAHYLTTPYGSLEGKTRLAVKGRIEGGPILGRYGGQSVMALYFQRRWDDWTDSHQFYRWWSSSTVISPIVEGPFEMVFNLEPKGCISMEGKPAEEHPDEFEAAKKHAGMVGMTFGGVGDGYGHGAKSVGPARVIIHSYTIE